MLSSLSRLAGKDRQQAERSPFSSPYSGLLSSPIAARRSSLEERRRPAADFDHALSPAPASRIDEEDEDIDEDVEQGEEEEDGEEEESNEDGAGETSPLLPIFSAAHLGILSQPLELYVVYGQSLICFRCSSRLQPHTRHTPNNRLSL